MPTNYNLTAEQIQGNWDELMNSIDTYISGDRKDTLKAFYEKYQERLIMMPAAHKKQYHNAMPGGYIEHVNRVVRCAIKQYKLWVSEGAETDGFTKEELIFSAINHDLGKMGDEEHESYIPQTDKWRQDKLGEDYTFNTQLPFASVPDRGLYMLQSHGIQYSFNEMLAIQTHDGLYDEANKKYLISFIAENKFRNPLPLILHQADMMAAYIEFRREMGPNIGKKVEKKDNFKLNNSTTKNKALGNVGSTGLKGVLDNL